MLSLQSRWKAQNCAEGLTKVSPKSLFVGERVMTEKPGTSITPRHSRESGNQGNQHAKSPRFKSKIDPRFRGG